MSGANAGESVENIVQHFHQYMCTARPAHAQFTSVSESTPMGTPAVKTNDHPSMAIVVNGALAA